MIKQNFAIICESAIIDKITNNLYLLGIFENTITSKLPVISRFAMVTKFEGGSGEHDHEIIIYDPSGNSIADLKGKINFGTNQKAQYIANFRGLQLNYFGNYKIEIYVDNILQPLNNSLNVKQKEL